MDSLNTHKIDTTVIIFIVRSCNILYSCILYAYTDTPTIKKPSKHAAEPILNNLRECVLDKTDHETHVQYQKYFSAKFFQNINNKSNTENQLPKHLQKK